MNTNNRILFADILRIIATFCVVLYHVCTDRWFDAYGNFSEWITIDFFVSELRWCVPMFFMLSGINFLDPKREVTITKLYKRSIPRIVCAIVFWSILYKSLAIGSNYFIYSKEITKHDFTNIIETMYFNPPSWFHLWYLYPFLTMYIMAPALRVFTANASKQIYTYLLILYGIFSFTMPILSDMYGIVLPFSIPDLVGYTGFFLGGYYFYKYDLTKTFRRILYTLGITIALILFYFPAYNSYQAGYPILPVYFGYQSLFIAIIGITIFVYAKHYFKNNPQKENKLHNIRYITLLSNCCFGIYLSHPIFLNVLHLLHINTGSFNVVLSIPFMAIFMFGSSLIITLIIKKIPILKKWII